MLNLLGINLGVYNTKFSKSKSSKCRCIIEVPSSGMRHLHWPLNLVYW
jgi:hypothetical protein